LLQRLARWTQPMPLPSVQCIDPIYQGAVFHLAADEVFRHAGAALLDRQGNLDEWLEAGAEIAAKVLAETVQRYPLWGSAALDRERCRLQHQIAALIRYEWQRPQGQFLASEWRFGEPHALAIPLHAAGAAPATTIYLRGSIDRIDALPDGGLSVRDLKTGFLMELQRQSLNPGRDLQLGTYVLVLEQLGFAGRNRVDEAAYVYVSETGCGERRFAGDDLAALRLRTREWLQVAHTLLSQGVLPRTPHAWDCRYCPFVPACGKTAQQRSAEKLAALPIEHPLHAFWLLKQAAHSAA
jgi:RecB family exonuclease